MEDSFKVRVDRLFGSLLSQSVPRSSFPAASWSVTDGEVEKREWNRERGVDPDREETPCASAYDDVGGCFARRASRRRRWEGDLDDLGSDEEEEGGQNGPGFAEDEEKEIRDSIGLDSTLDKEDEEDQYDRAAFYKEDSGDKIYMGDIIDRGSRINYESVVFDPCDDSITEYDGFSRDPRADHSAASVRLKEDKGEGENPDAVSSHHAPAVICPPKARTGDENLQPILKRKDIQTDSKPKKRVRFDTAQVGANEKHNDANEEHKESKDISSTVETTVATDESCSLPLDSPEIPDYIRNPSKYVCYSFDATVGERDDDERVNQQAFADFRKIISKSKSTDLEIECTTELPVSVVFTPRKKLMDAMAIDNEMGGSKENISKDPTHEAVISTGIAARDAEESEMYAMDEDEDDRPSGKEKNSSSLLQRRPDRKYRSKSSSDDDLES